MEINTLTLVVAAIGSGGVGAGIVALIKVKPERDKLVIDAAQGAVVVQSGVIENLQREIKRLADEHLGCEQSIKDLRDNHVSDMREDRKHYVTEMREMRKHHREEIEALRTILAAIDERQQERRRT